MMLDPEYQMLLNQPPVMLGIMSGHTWLIDPKRLTFTLSRYKFVAKMLDGANRVLEVGCGDGFASRIVRQGVNELVATDVDREFIMRTHSDKPFEIDFRHHDILKGPCSRNFDAAYSLDVLEHIPASQEHKFVKNIAASVRKDGVVIVGTPSLASQKYASSLSRNCHVNCKTAADLKALFQTHFRKVFSFSMNDEVVHTGFGPMANYLLVLCTNKKFL